MTASFSCLVRSGVPAVYQQWDIAEHHDMVFTIDDKCAMLVYHIAHIGKAFYRVVADRTAD